MSVELQNAVNSAVNLVNHHSGQTSVHLRFNDGEPAEIDFVANAASLSGRSFEFVAGYETYGGSLDELVEITAKVIDR